MRRRCWWRSHLLRIASRCSRRSTAPTRSTTPITPPESRIPQDSDSHLLIYTGTHTVHRCTGASPGAKSLLTGYSVFYRLSEPPPSVRQRFGKRWGGASISNNSKRRFCRTESEDLKHQKSDLHQGTVAEMEPPRQSHWNRSQGRINAL